MIYCNSFNAYYESIFSEFESEDECLKFWYKSSIGVYETVSIFNLFHIKNPVEMIKHSKVYSKV